MANPRLNPVVVAEQTAFIFEKKRAGYSSRAISKMYEEETGQPLSYKTVQKRLNRGLEKLVQPDGEALRKIESERLDYYLTKLESGVESGDKDAINTAIKVSESRRKLLGIDAPTRVDAVVVAVDPSQTAIGQLLAQRLVQNAQERKELEEAVEVEYDEPV